MRYLINCLRGIVECRRDAAWGVVLSAIALLISILAFVVAIMEQ